MNLATATKKFAAKGVTIATNPQNSVQTVGQYKTWTVGVTCYPGRDEVASIFAFKTATVNPPYEYRDTISAILSMVDFCVSRDPEAGK